MVSALLPASRFGGLWRDVKSVQKRACGNTSTHQCALLLSPQIRRQLPPVASTAAAADGNLVG
jgi:hypothetical protein